MAIRNRIDAKLAEEAAGWADRLSRDPEDGAEEFRDWACQSPAHIEEFLIARLTLSLFQGVDPQHLIDVDELIRSVPAAVVPLRAANARKDTGSSLDPAYRPSSPVRGYSRPKKWWPAALGACAIVLAILLLRPLPWAGLTYSTGLGERRTVRLADGSFVELNTRSSVRVQLGDDRRLVELLDGEALFKVAHDARRPFLVSTNTAVVRAVGTQFDVYLTNADTRVTVVEGSVQVTGEAPRQGTLSHALFPMESRQAVGRAAISPVTLIAGEQASVSKQGKLLRHPAANIPGAIAWRNGRLLFDATPLQEVIQEFARYSDFRISLLDRDLGQQKISGVFYADDPQTLVFLLDHDSALEVTRVENGVVVKRR